MGVTQHEKGEDAVRAVVNLALARGFVGREHCGLMPIRGHSGVQGGAEMGCYSTAFPGNVPIDEESAERFSELWDFTVPASRGLTAPEMIDAAHAGELDVLASSGGNFLEVLPDPAHVREALERVPLRVHADIVLSSQMLVDGNEVLLLPATTRYEIPGGVTETSTERRIIFSPEIPGPRIGEARPEWEIFTELARRVRPHLATQLGFDGTAGIRDEIARAVPFYDGIQRLREQGDHVQYGGERLCEGWRFPTADGKAHFALVPIPGRDVPEGSFVLSTRRGKQFNSMVQERRDSITGAARDSVLVNGADAEGLGLRDGDEVLVVNDRGSLAARVLVAPVARGCVQVHWPEGQVLIDRSRRSSESGVPDYNAYVQLERR
jgi:predicted molibdopterin-dependent oxidoreductase YjgC